jgi:hypothetical protein
MGRHLQFDAVLEQGHLVEPGTRALEGAFHSRRRGPEERGDEREPQTAARGADGRGVDERIRQPLQPRNVRRRRPQRLLRRL